MSAKKKKFKKASAKELANPRRLRRRFHAYNYRLKQYVESIDDALHALKPIPKRVPEIRTPAA